MTRRACAAVLGLAAALAAASPAAAQPRRLAPGRPERSPFLDGTHAFRRILFDVGRKGLKPLPDLALVEPSRTLVVVLGDPAPLKALDVRLNGLGSFVGRGGALLVATDHATPPLLLESFDVGVNGRQLTVPVGPGQYRGMPECPLIEPRPGASLPLFEPALPAGRDEVGRKVASNLPSHLHIRGRSEIPPLAFLPKGCAEQGLVFMGQFPFAAGGPIGLGRVLVMADQDVFINEMMLQRDNGNIDFSYRLADWLLTRPEGRERRDRILFYEDGEPQTKFDIPLKNLPAPPLPPPDTLMGMLDEMLPAMEQEGTFARMEEDDLANRAVEDLATAAPVWEETGAKLKLLTLAAILGGVALGLYGFVRLGMFRHRAESSGPTLPELLQKQAPAATVMAQRQLELLRDGNLWEAARDLARQTFLSLGLSPETAPLPPPIEVAGPWWRRWRTRLRWRRLWRLARSPRPVRVSPRGFGRLAEQVRALRAGLAGGTVRIN